MVPLNNVIMTVITRPVEGLMTFLSTMGCVQEIPLKPGGPASLTCLSLIRLIHNINRLKKRNSCERTGHCN